MLDENRERYTLAIQSVPSTVPVIDRLRRLIKALLRSYGFKVVEIREHKDDAGDE